MDCQNDNDDGKDDKDDKEEDRNADNCPTKVKFENPTKLSAKLEIKIKSACAGCRKITHKILKHSLKTLNLYGDAFQMLGTY